MKYSIRFLFLFILGIAYISFSPILNAADVAALLPNAVQQFFNNNGDPLTSGTVTTYDAGTSNLKTTWKDSAEVTPNTNPIRLDAGGKAIIYGNGTYRQVVKDKNGNLIWDAVTAPGGGGSTPTAVGDGNLVGTILPWSGLIAPNQYAFAYGQELSRTGFPEFYTATTQLLNVICSISSNTLTGLSDTTQIRTGSPVELICVPAGTTVVSKTASTVVLSNPSNISINTVATFFPWGNGNGTTTFNVPDLRGYVMAGRDNMGGTAASRLTTTYYGTNTPDALGATGGLQSSTTILKQSDLPPVDFVVTIPSGQGSHTHTASGRSTASSNIDIVFGNTGTTGTITAIAPATLPAMSGTAASGGTNTPTTAISNVQPTITVNYVVKITPDTSTSIATGVASLGGMTGVIACGTGILCTGNVVSFNGSVLAQGSTGSIQYKNPDGSFGGSANAIFISPDTLTLGAVGTTGKFDIYGTTSGNVRQTVQAIAGTPTVTWGTSSGTPAVTASTPVVLNSSTGNLTCPTCVTSSGGGAISGTAPISVSAAGVVSINAPYATLTASNGGIVYSGAVNLAILSGTAIANLPLLSGSSTTPSWATVSHPTSATSGGIAYFSSSTVMASSAALTANQIMIGGGAGSPPTTFACATTTTVVHGGAPPTCSQIVAADITTNTVTNANLAQVAAATLKGNPTVASANVQDFTIQGLSNLASPSPTLDFIPIYDHVAGTIKNVTPGAIAGSVVAGVASINALVGALTLANGNGISAVGAVGTTLTVSADIATNSNIWGASSNKLLDAGNIFGSAAAPVALSGTSTVTPDFTLGINFSFTATSATNYTLANPTLTSAMKGRQGCIYLTQPASGTVVTISYGTSWFSAGSSTGKSLTATLGAQDRLCYFVVNNSPAEIDFTLANAISH